MKVSLSDEAIEDARAAADWYIDQGASRGDLDLYGHLPYTYTDEAHRKDRDP